MKVTDLHLQNIRSYDDETVKFPEGTMLVHGENGAGKTTLLMGIFGGLFLSKIRNVGSNDFNLDDIVRRGAEEGEIALTFEVEDVPYTVTWTIDTQGPNAAVLDSPSLSEPVSGIRDVRSKVMDIVGMDEDSFSRSVYVQQGEVDRLFDDDARAELIDDLLGLDRIDGYELRMKGARRAVNRLKNDNEQSAKNHQETIEEQFDHDTEGYESELGEKETEIAEKDAEIDEVESFLEELREAKRDVEASIEEHDELQTVLEEKKEKREGLVNDRGEEQRAIEEAEAAINNAEKDIETLEERIEEKSAVLADLETPSTTDSIAIDLSTEQAANETLNAAQEAVEEAQIEKTDREGDLEQAKSERDRLIEERDELVEEKDALNSDLDHLRDEMEAVKTDVEAAQEDLTDAISARDAATTAFFPEESCPDSITKETLDTVDARVEELRTEKNEVSEERAGKVASVEAAEATLNEVQTDIADAEAAIEQREDKLEEVRTELESVREKRAAATEQFEADLDELATELDAFDLEVTGETLQTLIDDRIPSKKDELQRALDDAKSTVTKKEARKSTLEDDREELQALDGVATCPKCGQDVDPEHVEGELADIESEIRELKAALDDATQERDRLLERRKTLDSLREDAIELREYRADAIEAKDDREDDLVDDVDNLQDELEEAEQELDDAEDELESVESEVAELRSTIENFESTIEALETEIQEGKEVSEAFERAEKRREEYEDLADKLADLESEETDLEDDIEAQVAEISECEELIDEQRDRVADAESACDVAAEAVEIATERRELVSSVVDAYDNIDDLETSVESHEQDIGHARDTIENLNAQISDVEARIEEIEDDLGAIDVEEQRETLVTISDKIDARETSLDELNAELESLKEERTVLETDLERLEYFQDQLALAESKREWAQERADEFDRMIGVYRSTKADLREQYLAYINEYTNDIFTDIYKNNSYQQVRVLEEGPDGTPYAIQLLRDDGTLEHPSNASGGERAIVNLALRAGIYKLIAEMREGNTGRLPPFILDEPTTFLDQGHVGRLEQMLDSIAEWDVPQVIVVSHDERLIQGAEHEIEVLIDEDTNASRADVYRGGRIPGDD
ncbi:AAA family ATPase [Halosimplex pelagicum]|uniref:AAA family ATPase n=1 Tax=Halosimplex pelagicum TaxID=869886 RepID=A0A7D5TV77_9EURY|nr:AAA family ATPase [Halosimplex pelagicum]QLH83812.1 AAA family ATPase [Halosimplex pelagicum]